MGQLSIASVLRLCLSLRLCAANTSRRLHAALHYCSLHSRRIPVTRATNLFKFADREKYSSRERDTFGVAIPALLQYTRRTTGSSLVLGSIQAKCNAIRHAKDNFFSPLSFDDDAAVREIPPCGF
ncbi:hypothetical protein ACS0PU_003890 [Formica fusca]